MAKQAKILDLKPTQFAIGMLEVDEKVRQYRKMSRSEIKKEAKTHSPWVVLGPHGEYFLIDGHHRVMALWLMGFRKVPIQIKKDFRKTVTSYHQFWKMMNTQKWSHLHDQFGKGPHDPIYLPRDIRGISEDPYRSLAWMVRDRGGFKKSAHWFTDYEWANYFRRKHLLKEEFKIDYERSCKKALKLAKSSAAKKLPGYIGNEQH